MVHTVRQRPWKSWCATLLVCTLVVHGQGRLLAEQNDAVQDVSDVAYDSTKSGSPLELESSPVLISSSISMSPLSWFHQQLSVFATLEQAVLQRLDEGLVAKDAPALSSQADLLRHVGCARMRAALLNKAAQQSSGAMADGLTDVEEEHIEDSSGDSVSSRIAYAGNARLRGANPEDAAAVGTATTTSGSNTAATVSEARLLRSEDYNSDGYIYDYGYDLSEGNDQLYRPYEYSYGYEGEGEGLVGDAYIGAYEHDDEESEGARDDDEYDGDDGEDQHSSVAAVAVDGVTTQQLRDTSALSIQGSLEGRVLQLLEGAYALAFRSEDVASTSQGAAAEESVSSTSTGGSSASVRLSEAMERSEVGDDSYDLLGRADMLASLGYIYDDDDIDFGYEYGLYEDYYQAMTLADLMLAKLDAYRYDEDEWVDYLEHAYLNFYMDEGDEQMGYASSWDSSSAGVPNAIDALASIAELVVWAHMGNFVLEVRPAFSVSPIFEDGSVGESESVVLLRGDPYNTFEAAAYAAAALALADQELDLVAKQQLAMQAELATVGVKNDMSLRWVLPDGNLNWGLVMLVILSAGTAAMLVGCVTNWVRLRRTMLASSQGWVYTSVGKRCGGWADGFAAPLLLRPEDCKGAVCWAAKSAVEDAAEYVPPKVANESVAKALYK